MRIENLAKNLVLKVTRVLHSSTYLKKLGEFTKITIQKRTRAGQGVSNRGGLRPLASLSSSYKEFRRGFRGLSSHTSPNKSNLTLTGKLLSGLMIVLGKGKVTVKPSRNDEKKAQYNSSRRPFLDLSAEEQRRLKKIATEELKKGLKRGL